METLVKKSDIRLQKYKFFLNRIVIYLAFLLFPYLLQLIEKTNLIYQVVALLFFMTFMGGQWYLLGKEIDHRLRIYYRANSTMDRFLYRILNGSAVVLIYFNIILIFPNYLTEFFYWFFFIALGLFYSWPTRGKIIEESMSDQFSEFKFLDSFEKTVVYLTLAMFFVSLPEIPLFENIDALKMYLDPFEKIHFQQWNFLSVNYLPFLKYPRLFNVAFSFHFYFYGFAFYLLATYGILRFFISRRLSILGIFAIASTWSIPKLLDADFISIYTTTFPVLWLWSMIWSVKSSTYRSGLFVGLLNFVGVLINSNYLILYPTQILLSYFVFLPDKTYWYKQQWLKYNLLGLILCLIVSLTHGHGFNFVNGFDLNLILSSLSTAFSRKAFFSLSPIGVLILFNFFIAKNKKYFKNLSLEFFNIKVIVYGIIILIFFGIFIDKDLIRGFTTYWIFAFFALIPLEWIFQSISRLRSKRNIIYIMYILVCLLDSHFEGRLRIVGKLFFSDEVIKFLNQM